MRGTTNRRILTIVVGILAVAIVAFLAVGLILPNSWPGQVLRGSAIQAGGAEPTYASATVNGNTSDWDLANDFYADMYRAGNPNKPVEAKLYLRYDCPSSTMYVLVLSAGDWPILVQSSSEAWIKIDSSHINFAQMAWVDQGYDGDSSHARGYEAAFSLGQGDFTIQSHVNAFDSGESQTADSTPLGMTVICGGSTAVTISDFSAAWTAGEGTKEGVAAEGSNAVTVHWETASEIDNLGFNVYRSESEKGPWDKLNADLIPSQVPPGSPVGASYDFVDSKVEAGMTYFYMLEDIDLNGTATQHGPVQPK